MVKKKRLKTTPALIFILLLSMLVLANVDNQRAAADAEHLPPTSILTVTSEPPPAEQDNTTNPAPLPQIGQHEFALTQSVALISSRVSTTRSAGSHRNNHIFHQNGNNPKLEEATGYLSTPNTVFKQISRHYCQYLDIPPPQA